MSHFKAIVLIFLTFKIVVGCASADLRGQAGPQWISNMHRISTAHLKLLESAAEPHKLSLPSERNQVRARSKDLVEATASLLTDENAPNADPLISHTATEFAKELRQASAALEAGDYDWARYSILRTSNYCISCHTRTDRGAKDFPLQWSLNLTGFNKIQRFDVLLANRRYSSAMGLAHDIAGDKGLAKTDPHAWMKSLERALALAIRVNNDPRAASLLVQTIQQNSSAPSYVRRDAAQWLLHIREWLREDNTVKSRVSLNNAIRLMKKARQESPEDRSSLILNLRASGILHELFARATKNDYAEALFFAGMIEGSLKDLGARGTDQSYFERCIHESPHTELSERCFSRLEQAVRTANPYLELDPNQNYTVHVRLESLRELAEVKDPFHNLTWTKRWWELHEAEQEKKRGRNQ